LGKCIKGEITNWRRRWRGRFIRAFAGDLGEVDLGQDCVAVHGWIDGFGLEEVFFGKLRDAGDGFAALLFFVVEALESVGCVA
jgi:hypothetical protein